MADYYCKSRTNYFKVKKVNDFKAELGRYSAGEGGIDIWEEKGLIGLGSYGSMTTLYDPDTDDWTEIFGILQDHMEDGEAVILVESGNEKLRYVTGYAWVITKDDVKFIDVIDQAIQEAQQLVDKTADELLPQY